MSGFIRKSLYDLFELYIPGHYILNRIPNYLYKDYYIYQDEHKGILGVKFNSTNMCCHSGCLNCKIDCDNILNYNIEDILAMKIHSTYYTTYNLNNDKLVAEHIFNLFELH